MDKFIARSSISCSVALIACIRGLHNGENASTPLGHLVWKFFAAFWRLPAEHAAPPDPRDVLPGEVVSVLECLNGFDPYRDGPLSLEDLRTCSENMEIDRENGNWGIENSDWAATDLLEFLLDVAGARAWLSSYVLTTGDSDLVDHATGGRGPRLSRIHSAIELADSYLDWASKLAADHPTIWHHLKQVPSYCGNWWPNTLAANVPLSQAQHLQLFQTGYFEATTQQQENLPQWLLRYIAEFRPTV